MSASPIGSSCSELPVVVRMMEEANALKADESRLTEARQKYEAVVAFAKGQEIGSQEMRRLVDLAEQQVEALHAAAGPAPRPPPAAVVKAPGEVVPDSVTPQANSLFDGSFLRDFLVQPDPNEPDVFLGKAYASLGPVTLPVSFFVLQRAHRTTQPSSFRSPE